MASWMFHEERSIRSIDAVYPPQGEGARRTEKASIERFDTGLFCRLSELNRGHKDFQSFALPTELKRRNVHVYTLSTANMSTPTRYFSQDECIRTTLSQVGSRSLRNSVCASHCLLSERARHHRRQSLPQWHRMIAPLGKLGPAFRLPRSDFGTIP